MTLYEIDKDFKAWASLVDELTEICEDEGRSPTDDEMNALIEFKAENESNLAHKCENICRYMKNINSDAESLDDEIKRLQKKKKARENVSERLKNYLDFALKSSGMKKLQCGVFNLAIQKNPPSLDIYDETKVPAEWLIQQEPKIDRAGIKQAIKDGAAFDWCELKSTESIRIR